MVHKIKVYDRYTGQIMFVVDVKEKPLTRPEELRLAVLWALENGVSLHRADLSETYLYKTDLAGADLSKADLSKANLAGADLSKADLSKANLAGAYRTKGFDVSGIRKSG